MIEHIWTVVCSMSVVDRDTNNLSLFNVVEQLNIFTEPQPNAASQLSLDVVSLWVRAEAETPAQGKSRLTLLSPSGEILGQAEGEIDLSQHERLRMRRRFPLGLNLQVSGRYYFRVELQLGDEAWRTVTNVPLRVVVESSEGES
jgi:hypothetical protein